MNIQKTFVYKYNIFFYKVSHRNSINHMNALFSLFYIFITLENNIQLNTTTNEKVEGPEKVDPCSLEKRVCKVFFQGTRVDF